MKSYLVLLTNKTNKENKKMKIYAIRDSKAGAFRLPFFQTTDGVAARQFAMFINDPLGDKEVYNCPEDFDLYYIGEYNDANAVITSRLEDIRLVMAGGVAREQK